MGFYGGGGVLSVMKGPLCCGDKRNMWPGSNKSADTSQASSNAQHAHTLTKHWIISSIAGTQHLFDHERQLSPHWLRKE